MTVSLDAIWQVFLHKWDQVSPNDMENIHNMFLAIQVREKKMGRDIRLDLTFSSADQLKK